MSFRKSGIYNNYSVLSRGQPCVRVLYFILFYFLTISLLTLHDTIHWQSCLQYWTLLTLLTLLTMTILTVLTILTLVTVLTIPTMSTILTIIKIYLHYSQYLHYLQYTYTHKRKRQYFFFFSSFLKCLKFSFAPWYTTAVASFSYHGLVDSTYTYILFSL